MIFGFLIFVLVNIFYIKKMMGERKQWMIFCFYFYFSYFFILYRGKSSIK